MTTESFPEKICATAKPCKMTHRKCDRNFSPGHGEIMRLTRLDKQSQIVKDTLKAKTLGACDSFMQNVLPPDFYQEFVTMMTPAE